MPEQHIQVMRGLGMDQETIDKVEKMTPEELKDFKPDEIITGITGTFKTKFLNDPEFLNGIPEDKIPEAVKKKIESGQFNRFQAEMMEVAKKKLGLEDKDFEDMSRNEKTSLIKTLTEHIATKHSAKSGTVEGAKELQTKMTKLTEEMEAKDGKHREDMEKALAEVNTKAETKIIKALNKVALSSLDGITLKVGAGLIADPLLAKLTNLYTVILDDQGDIKLMQKANPKLDAMDASGNKKITYTEALKALALAEGVAEAKEKEEEEPGKTKKVTIGGEGSDGDDSFALPANIAAKVKKNEEMEKNVKV